MSRPILFPNLQTQDNSDISSTVSTMGSSNNTGSGTSQRTHDRAQPQEHGERAQKYIERQREHYLDLLREKWECELPDHVICVPTDDGQHFSLSDFHVEEWIDALCDGKSTTAEPPHRVFESIRGGAVFNRMTGQLKVKAVLIAPSRSRYGPRRPFNTTSARSVDSTITATQLGDTIVGGRSLRTSISSGVPGPGYVGGRVMKWLGEKGLDAIANAMCVKRGNGHIDCLQRWERRVNPTLGLDEREKVFEMLGDALEWSRHCYPAKVNLMAYKVGRQVQRWLQSYPEIPKTGVNTKWLIHVHICLIPLLLTRLSREDPLAGDLAYQTLYTLTKTPLALQGEDTVADVVRLVARELAYSKGTDHHPWLGVWLLRIVDMSLKVRDLTIEELGAIQELAIRREVNNTQGGEDGRRPWEVPLFALCASQDLWLKDVVLGPNGLTSLVEALDRMLSEEVRVVRWDDVALTLRALAFLSEQYWVVERVTPKVIHSLLRVFRRDLPERWFCIRFWAADTLRNMVALHQKIARILMHEGADILFESLLSPQFVQRSFSPSNVTSSAPISVRSNRRGTLNSNYTHTASPPWGTSPPISSPLSSHVRQPSSSSIPAGTNQDATGVDPTSARHGNSSVPPSPSLPRRPRGDSDSSGGHAPSNADAPQTPPSLGHRFSPRFRSSALPPEDNSNTQRRRNNTGVTEQQQPPSPNRRSMVDQHRTKVLEDYKREASKRASELVTFVQRWNEWTPDKLPRLEVVAEGVGWMSQFEGLGWTVDEGGEV